MRAAKNGDCRRDATAARPRRRPDADAEERHDGADVRRGPRPRHRRLRQGHRHRARPARRRSSCSSSTAWTSTRSTTTARRRCISPPRSPTTSSATSRRTAPSSTRGQTGPHAGRSRARRRRPRPRRRPAAGSAGHRGAAAAVDQPSRASQLDHAAMRVVIAGLRGCSSRCARAAAAAAAQTSASRRPRARRGAAQPQVLPKDTPPQDVVALMQQFTRALGVQCTYCHVAGHAAAR